MEMEKRACREKEVWKGFVFIGNENKMTWICMCDTGAGVAWNPCHFLFQRLRNGKIRLHAGSVYVWVSKFLWKWKGLSAWEKQIYIGVKMGLY